MNNKTHEPLFHLIKRSDISAKKAWTIRVVAFVLSILVCAIVSAILTDKGIGFFITKFFNGLFGSPRKVWNLFHETAIILIVALAVTPCFKMRFWNIGGEGQILMGALGSAVIIVFMGGNYADGLTIFLSLILAMAFSVVWALIPAVFKARWNTNETLLTLMMNYIAICIVKYFIKKVAPATTGTLNFYSGVIQPIFNDNEFILKIIIVAVITVIMAIYLKSSKHGYELMVVGESPNTARYIGLNTKKIIIRTLILCGVLCGITGFLLVSATNHSLGSETVGGRGFTGVLVSWLAHFNPIAMALTSFLFVFVDMGATQVATDARLGSSYPSVMTGIFFFFIIATEFLINYKIVMRGKEKGEGDRGDSSEKKKSFTENLKTKIENLLSECKKLFLKKDKDSKGTKNKACVKEDE